MRLNGKSWDLRVDIVVELVVTGEGKKNSETWSKREEHLSSSVHPNLETVEEPEVP